MCNIPLSFPLHEALVTATTMIAFDIGVKKMPSEEDVSQLFKKLKVSPLGGLISDGLVTICLGESDGQPSSSPDDWPGCLLGSAAGEEGGLGGAKHAEVPGCCRLNRTHMPVRSCQRCLVCVLPADCPTEFRLFDASPHGTPPLVKLFARRRGT